MKWGLLSGTTIVDAIVANSAFVQSLPNAADWVALPYGAGIGWEFDGATWTGPDGEALPPAPGPTYRTLVTGPEWVALFTADEWEWLKTRRNDGTAAGKRLDQMLDAIRWTDSVNTAAESMDEFYTWLLNQGIPGGQARIDELRQGVPA